MSGSGPPTKSPRPPAARRAALRGHRRHLRQPRGWPGDLFVAMPGTVHDGHKFVEAAFAARRRGRDRFAAGRRPACARRRHVRRAPGARPRVARAQPGDDLRSHRLGRQDEHQGSALRRARPQPAGQGPPLGQELQQSHRRSAEPRPNAARRRVRGARNGHEPCRRNPRADRAGAPARRDRSPQSRPRTSKISARKKPSPTPRRRFSKGSSRTESRSYPMTRRIATGW